MVISRIHRVEFLSRNPRVKRDFGLLVILLDVPSRVSRVLVPFLVLGVPVCDGLVVIADRLRRGVAPWTPGHDHLSHRLVARGLSVGRAALILVGASFGLAAAANLAYGGGLLRVCMAAILALIMLACLLHAHKPR